jgi:PTS system glucitol/sorbitol-specific IIA component
MIYYSTTVTAIGAEAAELLDGGLLVLYGHGAPEALAEISVQHRVSGEAFDIAPPVGARVSCGSVSGAVTAVGDSAWNKVRDMGHVVLNFSGADHAERPGEICVEHLDPELLGREIRVGARILIAD